MLNVVFRLAAPWACAWAVWAPAVQAAEAPLPEKAVSAPFTRYQGWRDEPLQGWREANERVGEIGGWRTYLREAQPAVDGAGRHAGHAPGRFRQPRHGGERGRALNTLFIREGREETRRKPLDVFASRPFAPFADQDFEKDFS